MMQVMIAAATDEPKGVVAAFVTCITNSWCAADIVHYSWLPGWHPDTFACFSLPTPLSSPAHYTCLLKLCPLCHTMCLVKTDLILQTICLVFKSTICVASSTMQSWALLNVHLSYNLTWYTHIVQQTSHEFFAWDCKSRQELELGIHIQIPPTIDRNSHIHNQVQILFFKLASSCGHFGRPHCQYLSIPQSSQRLYHV